MLLQKEYITDPITKRRKKNNGELPKYYVENTHEAIIDMETFRWVQKEKVRPSGKQITEYLLLYRKNQVSFLP